MLLSAPVHNLRRLIDRPNWLLGFALILCASILSCAKSAQAAIWNTPVILHQNQVVPPSGSPAQASGFFVLDTENNQLNFNLNLDQPLEGNELVTALYGPAAFGENAEFTGQLFQLPPGWPKNGSWNYPDSIEAWFLQHRVYVQVETDVHPQGEIRGQLAAWQAQGLNQTDAYEYMNEVLVPLSIHADSLSAYMYGFGSNDSLLTAGTVVSDSDSNLVFTLPTDMYFFWFDNEPEYEFMHSTGFFFMDTFSGQLFYGEGTSWPVVNGFDVFLTDDDSGACNLPAREPLIPEYTPTNTNNSTDWAVIVVGKNLGNKTASKELERDARKNDIQRIKEYLNGVDKGPNVDDNNIVVVPGADTTGATVAEVCAALENLSGCRKLHFFYIGHGSNGSGDEREDGRFRKGYMILKKEGSQTQTDKLTFYKLACKLLETGVEEVCITIEACYSGWMITQALVKEKDGKKLKGSVVSSSSAGRKTRRGADGAFFIKSFLACSKDPVANLNGDNRTTHVEAAAWAEANDGFVQIDDPQARFLGDRRNFRFARKRVRPKDLWGGINGRKLRFEIHTYTFKVRTADGKRDSSIVRKKLFVRNLSDEPHLATLKIEVRCNRPRGHVIKLPAPIRHMNKDAGQHNWTYLGQLPEDCTCVTTWLQPGQNKAIAGGDTVLADLIERTSAYRPGEFIFQDFDVMGQPGDTFSTILDSIPGWSMSLDTIGFNAAATVDTQMVALRGTVPGGALVGGSFGAEIVNTVNPDTLRLDFEGLIYDSLSADVVAGETHVYHALDMFGGGLDATGGTVTFDHTSMNLHQPASVLIPAGGSFDASFAQIEADTGLSFPLDVFGNATLSNINFVRSSNGLHLDTSGSVDIDFAVVLLSLGDGLSLDGDQSTVVIDGLLIDESMDDGIEGDAAVNIVIDQTVIENSGDFDVSLVNGSSLELRNCYFDDSKVSVDGTSQLTRTWSIAVLVVDANGVPLPNTTVEIRDVHSTLLETLTTDSNGLTSGVHLNEWVQNGASRNDLTPHEITAIRGGVTTTINHVLDDKLFPVVMMSDIVVGNDEEEELQSPRALILSQNTPNPFGSLTMGRSTSILYALPRPSEVTLQIYNVRGQLVESFHVGAQTPGYHTFNLNGARFTSGLYWYELRTSLGSERRKMLVIK